MILPKSISTTIRMDEYTKALLDKAAALTNVSQTSFILSVVREKAEQVIQERKATLQEIVPLLLNEQDSRIFLDALEGDFDLPVPMQELNKHTHQNIIDRTV
jgi:uncharacterized protein (DUF1778 family)